MIYLILFFSLMFFIVVQIEKRIIDSKYLIKKAHKYRHATRKERVERRKEIEEYKKSLTHKYYLDKNLKDPQIKKMLNKNRYKSLDAFRFEARLFYYGFFISILFGFFFTITGLYKDEFVSSLYPYIQPYFKVLYSNFERYTFNPLSFKVCFSWIFVFSVLILFFYSFILINNLKKFKNTIEKFRNELNGKKINISMFFLSIFSLFCIYNIFNDKNVSFYIEKSFYSFPISFGGYFILIQGIFLSLFLIIIILSIYFQNIKYYLQGKLNAY